MYTPEKLLDHVAEVHNIKNDAALARLLEVHPSTICVIRSGRLQFGDTLMLRIHELPAMYCMKFRDMRLMIGKK
jgi:hypothetical protein